MDAAGRNRLVDATRLVMACGVVLCHILAVNSGRCGELAESFDWFFAMIVPYFFVTGGVFLARRIERKDSGAGLTRHLKGRFLGYCRMWVKMLLIYLPLAVFCWWNDGGSGVAGLLKAFGRDLLISGSISPAWMMWFLWSGAIAFLLAWQLQQRGWLWGGMMVAGAVAFVWPLIFSEGEGGLLTRMPYHIGQIYLPGISLLAVGMALERWRPRSRRGVCALAAVLLVVWLVLSAASRGDVTERFLWLSGIAGALLLTHLTSPALPHGIFDGSTGGNQGQRRTHFFDGGTGEPYQLEISNEKFEINEAGSNSVDNSDGQLPITNSSLLIDKNFQYSQSPDPNRLITYSPNRLKSPNRLYGRLFFWHMYPVMILQYTVNDALFALRGMIYIIPLTLLASLLAATAIRRY